MTGSLGARFATAQAKSIPPAVTGRKPSSSKEKSRASGPVAIQE